MDSKWIFVAMVAIVAVVAVITTLGGNNNNVAYMAQSEDLGGQAVKMYDDTNYDFGKRAIVEDKKVNSNNNDLIGCGGDGCDPDGETNAFVEMCCCNNICKVNTGICECGNVQYIQIE